VNPSVLIDTRSDWQFACWWNGLQMVNWRECSNHDLALTDIVDDHEAVYD